MRRPARPARDGAAFWLPLATLGLLLALCKLGAARAGSLAITVLAAHSQPLPGVVITLHALTAGAHPAAPVHAIMDQVERVFVPDLLVIPIGSTVEFPNSDSVNHQIYSFSPARRFQLPLYHGKPYPPVRFDNPGLITLGCNIHDEMLAYVLVTDAPFFGITDAAGTWSAEVPPGRYRVAVWHPRLRDEASALERELTVGELDRANLTVRLMKPLQPAPLEGQPHSWDQY